MLTANISSKGQVTLPRTVRQALDLKPGGRVLFVVDASGIQLRTMGPSSAQSLAGSLVRYATGRRATAKTRRLVKKEVARAAAKEG